jgi:3-oxoacyl-[acyl-carrier-protein] synthase III
MIYSKITGLGHYVPQRVVTNHDLEQVMDTTDAWIQERTGIRERRYATYGTDTNASMAAEASRMALEQAGLQASDVQLIVYATITPEYYFPGSAFMMQRMLGMAGIGVIDIREQCSGFVYALSIADQFIRTGTYQRVLVVGSEVQSPYINASNEGRNVAVIFGDGAGAAVLQATTDAEHRVLSAHLHADGTHAEELYVKGPNSNTPGRWFDTAMQNPAEMEVYMNGNAVFKHAVVRFTEAIQEALTANGYQASDIALLVPHQANIRISEFVRQQMGLHPERVVNNIQHYGNTTAASIPIALSEAWQAGRIQPGDLICLAAFGSGFTWASALIRW